MNECIANRLVHFFLNIRIYFFQDPSQQILQYSFDSYFQITQKDNFTVKKPLLYFYESVHRVKAEVHLSTHYPVSANGTKRLAKEEHENKINF